MVVRSVTQLLPELAAELAGWRRIVLVDARPADGGDVAVEHLRPQPAPKGVTTHQLDPRGVLALAAALDVEVGEVVVVTVPATDLSLGTDLSSSTRQAVGDAVELVMELCST